jgi:hypothetical protein
MNQQQRWVAALVADLRRRGQLISTGDNEAPPPWRPVGGPVTDTSDGPRPLFSDADWAEITGGAA